MGIPGVVIPRIPILTPFLSNTFKDPILGNDLNLPDIVEHSYQASEMKILSSAISISPEAFPGRDFPETLRRSSKSSSYEAADRAMEQRLEHG